MRLTSIELQDVRRFHHYELGLEPGLSVLSGANGAGKTTILDSIGFALFGTALSDGIRDGASELSVRIGFTEASEDWVASRSQSASGTRAELRNATTGQSIATGSEAVLSHLAGWFRLSDRTFLPVLFRRIIGIAQGDLERPFLLPTAERAAWFQPLLNLERYDLAARRVAVAATPFQAEIQQVERELASAHGELKGFESIASRLRECDADAIVAAERATAIEARIAELTREAAGLEQSRAELERSGTELKVLEEASRRRQDDTELARTRLDQTLHASQVVAKTRGAHERFRALTTELGTSEQRRRDRDALIAEVDALERKLADGRAAIDAERTRLEQALDDAQRSSEETLALREALRARIDEYRTRARQAEGAGNALRMANIRAAELRRCLGNPSEGEDHDAPQVVRGGVRDNRAAEAAADDAAARATAHELDALRRRADGAVDRNRVLMEARAGAARLQGLRRAAESALALARPAHGACPLLVLPCQNLGGSSLTEHLEGELRRLDDALETAADAIRIAENRVVDAEQAARELERRERESGPRRPRARAAATPPPATATRPPLRATPLAFDQIGHHLSALAGVIGAIAPLSTRPDRAPVALIGATAGIGDNTHTFAGEVHVELPHLAEIERGQELAAAGLAAQQAGASERETALGAELFQVVRRVCSAIVGADAQIREVLTHCRGETSRAEETLLASAKHMEALASERVRLREATKGLSTRDLGLLDAEIALSDRRVRFAALERGNADVEAMRRELESLRGAHEQHEANAFLAYQVDTAQEDWKRLDRERADLEGRAKGLRDRVAELRGRHDSRAAEKLARDREDAHTNLGQAREAARSLQRERELLRERLGELEHVRLRLEALDLRRTRAEAALATVGDLETLYRRMAEPVADRVQRHVAEEADALYREIAQRTARLRWHDDFSITLEEASGTRGFAALAHGDRVTAALAVILALHRQFPRVGILCLDEPTAHLDPARRHAFAEALSSYRASSREHLEQILIVSHDRAFDHVAEFHATLPQSD